MSLPQTFMHSISRPLGSSEKNKSGWGCLGTVETKKDRPLEETGGPKKKKRGGDPKGEVEEKSSEKTRAGRSRKRRGESQSFFYPCCCPRVENADEKQRLADWTETSCGESGFKTGIPYRL
ncbi:hypothetical protein TNCV_1664601 [Trichonephila clavipes]|uniref:Uncharacterized protein n=1 Tax=Trichonephila clavipes TaxID=2585209 RepID=A0A8X6RUF4_TRICX|nr:hypothetical protein TNCV_1664601 [Trichonephila clavipes]